VRLSPIERLVAAINDLDCALKLANLPPGWSVSIVVDGGLPADRQLFMQNLVSEHSLLMPYQSTDVWTFRQARILGITVKW
jgi:hypothetical protein